MIYDILKNPIVLGVFFATMTYLYLLWDQNKDKKNRNQKNPSLFIPFVVGVVVVILSYAFFYNSNTLDIDSLQDGQKSSNLRLSPDLSGNNNGIELSEESGSSFHLISKGMSIPNQPIENFPDVFIETFSN